MTDYDTLYPNIGGDFRLHKVNEALSKLAQEHAHYEKVRKKYARWRSLFYNTSKAVGSVSVIFTGAGVATSLTGPGIIVGIPLSAVGGVMSLITIASTIASFLLTRKISKHEKTVQLAISKENSINDLVSKALTNNVDTY